jgi:hypothetical protein
LTTAASGAPRFDYDPVTHVARGLLIEEARTNGFWFSQDFTNSNWTKTGATITADQTTAPDGTVSADLVTASAATATVGQTDAATTAARVVMSIFAKKGSSDWIYLSPAITGTGAETPKAWFNLATGAVGTIEANVTSATIQDVGSGWYRCAVTRTATAGTENLLVGPCDANGSAAVTIGRTIYLWGGQSEQPAAGGIVSSYIPTLAGADVTRAADVATMTGTNFSSWYDQTAGTFVVEFDVSNLTVLTGIVQADDGSSTGDRFYFYGTATADPKISLRDNNILQADFDLGTLTANAACKLGLSFAVNDIAGCFNGGTVGTDTVAALPTLTQLRIGVANLADDRLNGHIRRIQFQNTALTDAELVTLTTPGPWPGGEPVPPAVGPTTTGGAAFWDQDYDGREYESSRKRRKRFLEERARRIAEL